MVSLSLSLSLVSPLPTKTKRETIFLMRDDPTTKGGGEKRSGHFFFVFLNFFFSFLGRKKEKGEVKMREKKRLSLSRLFFILSRCSFFPQKEEEREREI